MVEPKMPVDVMDWMNARNWGDHHLSWHTARQWDLLGASDRAWAEEQGWSRADRQEGAPGNGFDFLLMHRAMIQLLRETFPAHAALLAGWAQPPTDPNSARDPMPPNNPTPRVFSANMQTAVANLQSAAGLAVFASDDELGLYIETPRRPTADDVLARSPDPSTGIHNYLHNRFSDSTSDVNLGNPELNLANERFWRLHGWIDARWTAFREAKGLSDTDPAYVAALQAEKTHLATMGMGGHGGHHPLADLVGTARKRRTVPRSIAEPFREHVSRRFAAAMASGAPANLQELKERIQLAIELEFFTIPLYLTAAWSLDTGASASTGAVRNLIMHVALQEMLHMGLMCNLLVAVGGKPILNHPDHLPRYPNFPPGVDLPTQVELKPFSPEVLDTFLRIELPQHDPLTIPVLELEAVAMVPAPKFPTIGDFYDSLAEGLVHATSFTAAGQLTSSFGTGDELTVIASLDDAKAAIELIKEQGEGNLTSPAAGPAADDLAHYYHFLQIKDGRKYVKQPDGAFKQDPNQPIPFPSAAEIYPMAPVPGGGYPGVPESDTFNITYSGVVQALHDAWNQGEQMLLDGAVNKMFSLEAPAIALMKKPRDPSLGGNYGPAFRWKIAPITPPEPPPGPPPVTAGGYARIQQILDDAVHGNCFGAHGPFWRGITRDQFVAKAIFGRKLLATRPDGSFDPVESNLMKALEGRPPFDGSLFRRMPDGYPPIAESQLAEIRTWITVGCPETPAGADWFDETAGGPINGQQHNDYWRDFDDWAMVSVTDDVSADIGAFFNIAGKWTDFAKDATKEADWVAALAVAEVRAAVGRLESKQRETVTAHYGMPIPLVTLLDGYERFGDNTLPDDPRRPADVRHTMNGNTMWFVWSAFADACLRIGGDIPAEFWQGMSRAILIGLLNDGLFRGRFKVTGFTADASGKAAIRAFVKSLPVANISAELRSRYRDFLP